MIITICTTSQFDDSLGRYKTERVGIVRDHALTPHAAIEVLNEGNTGYPIGVLSCEYIPAAK